MKQLRTRLTAWLLVLGMIATMVVSASASDYWWQQYVTNPDSNWAIQTTGGKVTSQGANILFTSDVHRYTYLVKDLLAEANSVVQKDGSEANVGLMSFGGDFANEKLLYDDNMSILKAALATSPNTAVTFTKGNHEGNVSDADFEAKTGMSRIGETAVNASGDYHFFNFGAFNGTDQFRTEDIALLQTYLEGLKDQKPVFIVSHYPIHYYNDRRSAKNAAALVTLLNQYPQVVFLWGHNHTEQDPNYGMIRTPGDILQTGASPDSSVEIHFTYACLGALRDGINGANGLLATVDGTRVRFRYIALHNTTSDDTWTDAQGNENPVKLAGTPEISTDTTVDTAADQKTITLANVQIDRPLVDKTPDADASVFSTRFSAGAVTWKNGTADFTSAYDFSTAYTASVTLTAADGYKFASDAAISVNKLYTGPMPGQTNFVASSSVSSDGKTAAITYTFPKTVDQGASCDAAATIENGGRYILAAIDQNMAAEYRYDPTQHGDESMPDYSARAADVVIHGGKLISSVDPFTVFTAQKDENGFLLSSDASLRDGQGATTLNYLNMSTRGGELGLEASETVTSSRYCDWNLTAEGLPCLDFDGTTEYGAFVGGKFTFVTDPAACNLRLFAVGTDTSKVLYNLSVAAVAPEAGQTPDSTVADEYDGYTATLSWDTTGTLGYDTVCTATATVTPKTGYTLSDTLIGRIGGDAADTVTKNADGTVTLVRAFPATESKPGLTASVKAVKSDKLESGKSYVLVSGGTAMTRNFVDGLYAKAVPVTEKDGLLTSKITSDMIFTASGDDTAGYTLQNSGYLAAKAVGTTPDTWGFTTASAASGAIAFTYADQILTVVPASTGPTPTVATTMYLSNGHFNCFTTAKSAVTLYEVSADFTDVTDPAAYYFDPVHWAVFAGITGGVGGGRFDPSATCTRAEAVTFLWRAAGCPSPANTASPFTDVQTSGDYYYSAVLWASEQNITNGVGGGRFDPTATVSRSQLVTMIYRAQKAPAYTGENTFTDVQKTDFFYDAVVWGSVGGIVKGTSDTTFSPAAPCSRGEAVTFLYRAK